LFEMWRNAPMNFMVKTIDSSLNYRIVVYVKIVYAPKLKD